MPSVSPNLAAAMTDAAHAVEDALDRLLPKSDFPEHKLFDAMRYGTLSGGKRLRPFLVMSAAKIFGVGDECALRAAAAVECIHCYSLIHDDLPAMDNSDLRRGQPTVHKNMTMRPLCSRAMRCSRWRSRFLPIRARMRIRACAAAL